MDNFKGTPGPWKKDPKWGDLRGANNMAVATHGLGLGTVCGGNPSEEEIANARLVATAPELLEALQSLVANLDEGDFISTTRIGVAKTAIARALGQ